MNPLHLLHSLYSAMWSNIWAPSAWTLVSVGVSHLALRRLHKKHHAEQMTALQKDSR